MPQPVSRDLHVDQLLTQLSIAYRNPEYIADTIFPIVSVAKQSDKLVKYDQSHWFRDEARIRAPRTRSVRSGYTVDTSDTYFCDRYSFAHEIADEERDNADSAFDLEQNAIELTTDKLGMRREVQFAADFFKTGVWATDKVGTTDFTKWSDYGNSQPLIDIATWLDIVEGAIGRQPNTMVMGKQVWTQLKWHPDLIDTIKYTQRAQMTMDLFAALVEIDRVLVGKSIYTTSPEGTAEASVAYTRIWGKNAMFTFAPARPSLLMPSAGYTFVWRRVAAAIQYIRRMRDDEREVDILEANSYFDQKVTGTLAGLFASAAVA